MPPRRKYNRKRRRNRKKKSSVPRMLSLGPTFPNGLIAKHKYSMSKTLQATYVNNDIPGTAQQSFRTASLFDPDRTGGGAQPLFFDEMAAIYNQYRILGAKCRLRFVNMSEEPIIVFGAHLGAPLGTGWSPGQLMERRDVKSQFLSPMSAGGKNQTTMSLFYSPSKFYKQRKENLRADNSLVGNGAGDVVPSKMTYFEVALAQVDQTLGASANHAVKIYVEIEYTAFWNDRKLNTHSS